MKLFSVMKSMFLIFLMQAFVSGQPKLLDGFENINDWNIHKSDGVSISLKQVQGYNNKAIAIDYSFSSGGYCGINKVFSLELPDNYEFTFMVKAESPNNNLEFKLIDSSGDNVWWLNQRNFEFSKNWKKVIIKKRNISYAWGPLGGGEIKKTHKIEIIIAAGNGGKGRVVIDNLTIEQVDNSPVYKSPAITSSSWEELYPPVLALDGNKNTFWTSCSKNKKEWFQIDLNKKREFSGIVIDWKNKPAKFDIEVSDDAKIWSKVYAVKNKPSDKSYILLPQNASRFLRINFEKYRNEEISINDIDIKDPAFGDDPINLFELIAKENQRGFYPKHLLRDMSYWTIFGSENDEKEALINENGLIEVDKSSFSIEPFVAWGDKLATWNDVKSSVSLENNYLPIPIVKWDYSGFEMNIKAFSFGEANKSEICVSYKIRNTEKSSKKGAFYLTFRPFQVNPIWQFLNITGGLAKINSINISSNTVSINKNKQIYSLVKPASSGAVSFDEGNIVDFIAAGIIPDKKNLNDISGYASGAMKFEFDLQPQEEKEYYFIIPFYEKLKNSKMLNDMEAAKHFNEKLLLVTNSWEEKLNRVKIELPEKFSNVTNTLKSYLAYILINRDNNAIQPGSRSYERAWIRDGSLTGGALLHFGITDEVKKYLDWYSKYIYENGKVPCVVDKRGADPVPENDSHGEYIYAVLNYYHFTKDKEFLRSHFSTIKKVVEYIDTLTMQRKTDKYKSDEYKAYYGLVPESISHEGYSAKPMHSYWDDFFIMKGLKDAVTIASILEEKNTEDKFIKIRDEFKTNLYNSLNLAMKKSNIDYVPGCVELGDFDATSTAIALYPCNEYPNLPKPQINNTFDKYFDFFSKRKNGLISWDNYTPYEVRLIGALTLMNEKKKAHDLLDFFMKDQRPQGWNHWAEVVWSDPKTPKFIGDMPHTWVGSDYINSIRNMFVFEDELNESLIIGLGIKEEWLNDTGVVIENMPTQYGKINIKMKKDGDKVVAEISGDVKIPRGKIVLKNPMEKKILKSILNGKEVSSDNEDLLIVQLPIKVEMFYR